MNRSNHISRRIVIVTLLYVTGSVFCGNAVALNKIKRSDQQDSYLDALQKNHDDDSSNC